MCFCIQIWDKQTLECLKILTGHTGSVLWSAIRWESHCYRLLWFHCQVRFYRSLALYKSSVHFFQFFSSPPPPHQSTCRSAGMNKGLDKISLTLLVFSFYPELGCELGGRFWTLWSTTTRPCFTCEFCKRADGHLFEGSLHCRVGTWPLLRTSVSAGSSVGHKGCSQCGRLWRQVHCLCLWGSDHKGQCSDLWITVISCQSNHKSMLCVLYLISYASGPVLSGVWLILDNNVTR